MFSLTSSIHILEALGDGHALAFLKENWKQMLVVTQCCPLRPDGSGGGMKTENLNATFKKRLESMFYILRSRNMLTEVEKYGLSPFFPL